MLLGRCKHCLGVGSGSYGGIIVVVVVVAGDAHGVQVQ